MTDAFESAIPEAFRSWVSERRRSKETYRDTFIRYAISYRSGVEKQLSFLLDRDGLGSRELVIGAGFHAATFAINRGLSYCISPDPPGGIFAMGGRPVFYVNSRNRPMGLGLEYNQPGSQGPLNEIVGGFFQPSELSMLEHQEQSDISLAVRLMLASYSRVQRGRVVEVTRTIGGYRVKAVNQLGKPIKPDRIYKRIIAATGLTEPRITCKLRGRRDRIMDLPTFLRKMGDPTNLRPLKGYKRVAIVGKKDSGKIVAEWFLGLGPQPGLSTAAQDAVERITWIGQDALTKEVYEQCERSRYAGLGRSFPRIGNLNYYYRIEPAPGRALEVTGGSQTATVDWMSPQGPRSEKFDLVVLCTGFENKVDELFAEFDQGTDEIRGVEGPIARQYRGENIYVIGPAAELTPTEAQIKQAKLDLIQESVASAFRYGPATAAFAKYLNRLDAPKARPMRPKTTRVRTTDGIVGAGSAPTFPTGININQVTGTIT